MTGLPARLLGAALLAVAPGRVPALEIVENSVGYVRPQLTVRFEGTLDADPGRVHALAVDYAGLAGFSPLLRGVFVEDAGGGSLRVTARFHMCLLFFCRDIDKITLTPATPGSVIMHRVIPGAGDFVAGEETLTITASDRGGTLLRYEAQLVSRMFLPPLIGALLIERLLRRELAAAAGRLERAAQSSPNARSDSPISSPAGG